MVNVSLPPSTKYVSLLIFLSLYFLCFIQERFYYKLVEYCHISSVLPLIELIVVVAKINENNNNDTY